MWSRAELKRNAKEVLKGSYFSAFIASLFVGLFTGADNFGGVFTAKSNNAEEFAILEQELNKLGEVSPEMIFAAAAIIIAAILFASAMAKIFAIFVTEPFKVGESHYLLEATQFRFSFSNVFYGFTCGKYLNVVMTMFLTSLFQFFWTLLFIIPGFVKAFAYYLVPFIMAENPNISPKQAINISCRMTKGYKWDMFVLDLSFIGWYLLGTLCFGIGVMFVRPYHKATLAQLYLALRTNALDSGRVSLSELEAGM